MRKVLTSFVFFSLLILGVFLILKYANRLQQKVSVSNKEVRYDFKNLSRRYPEFNMQNSIFRKNPFTDSILSLANDSPNSGSFVKPPLLPSRDLKNMPKVLVQKQRTKQHLKNKKYNKKEIAVKHKVPKPVIRHIHISNISDSTGLSELSASNKRAIPRHSTHYSALKNLKKDTLAKKTIPVKRIPKKILSAVASEISQKKAPKKSVADTPVPITGIPIGYNQIQQQLNSYVRNKNSSKDMAVNNLQQLVVDKTHTNIGEQFFNTFNNYWQPPSAKINYVITITEKPLPSMGTMIMVKVDNEIAFQAKLNPESNYILAECRVAIQYVLQKLKNQQTTGY